MKKLMIMGNASYARMMKRYIDLASFGEVAAYVADAECIREKEIDRIPVLSLEEMRAGVSCEDVLLIMGIGYKKMGDIRKKVFEQCKSFGYRFANFIHPTAIIEKNVVMGEGNNILEGVILEESVVLGNANLLFGGSLIAHETTIGDYNTFSVKSVAAGCTTVGSHCFIGAAAAVKDHVTMGDYVLLGAMAFGFQDLEAYSVVVPEKSRILDGRKSTDFL